MTAGWCEADSILQVEAETQTEECPLLCGPGRCASLKNGRELVGFYCDCEATGYSGAYCEKADSILQVEAETQTEVCDRYCGANGSCAFINSSGRRGQTCICDAGYSGDYCQKADSILQVEAETQTEAGVEVETDETDEADTDEAETDEAQTDEAETQAEAYVEAETDDQVEIDSHLNSEKQDKPIQVCNPGFTGSRCNIKCPDRCWGNSCKIINNYAYCYKDIEKSVSEAGSNAKTQVPSILLLAILKLN